MRSPTRSSVPFARPVRSVRHWSRAACLILVPVLAATLSLGACAPATDESTGPDEVDPSGGAESADAAPATDRIVDDRLPAEEPVFGFMVEGAAWAVTLREVEGGAVFEHPTEPIRRLVIHHDGGGGPTRAWVTEGEISDREALMEQIADPNAVPPIGVEAVSGEETVWEDWVAAHPDSGLIGGEGA